VTANVADSFGCPLSKLTTDQRLLGPTMNILRKGTRSSDLGQVEMPASDRGFLVGLSTGGGHRRRIFHEHHATTHDFSPGSIYIRNLSQDYKADLSGSFDFLLFEISAPSLAMLADEADLSSVRSLFVDTASPDPVLASLGQALAPALQKPAEASRLFVEQMTAAIGTHLVQRYGGQAMAAERKLKLSRAHERVAREMLGENLGRDMTIAQVAQACNLSRGHFIRMFRETLGMTPHQWVIGERIRRARALLRETDLPLAEVAITCGFSDQSHFTRVFSSNLGIPPGTWRKKS
jgi:AraC-like DNA-binding protein